MITNQNRYFDKKMMDEAVEHCRSVWPQEGCGAFIEDEFVPFDNVDEDPDNNYRIGDPKFYDHLQEGNVQCVIHSHEDYPHASAIDQQQQLELDVPFGIINFKNKGASHFMFWGRQLPTEPLMNRPFFFGIYDCWSLVTDWLKVKKGFICPTPIRDFGFWNKGDSVYEEFLLDYYKPYKKVTNVDNVQEGDLLFYNLYGTKFICHSAVMQNNHLVLHHFYNKITGEYPLSYQQQYLKYIYRFDPTFDEFDHPECRWEKI